MKKNDDGYVLVFVMVVLIVLCISSVTLMSTSLSNLQKQQDTMESMGIYTVEEGKTP